MYPVYVNSTRNPQKFIAGLKAGADLLALAFAGDKAGIESYQADPLLADSKSLAEYRAFLVKHLDGLAACPAKFVAIKTEETKSLATHAEQLLADIPVDAPPLTNEDF